MYSINYFLRRLSFKTNIKPKICIVGSGPAGFYAAQHLAKKINPVEIDIYEKLPVPFGLVRFGVAPDHPEVKNVIHTFTKTAEKDYIRFVGNINLGKDISLKQLQELYHVVLLTYGAEENKQLNIPGENLENVLAAREIVGWYNGMPKDANLNIDFDCESVAIFGQGNVAIDVARILLSPIDLLKTTDITQHALEALANSKIKQVHLIGRRGPLQAAFTIKELREMLKLQNCATYWHCTDFQGIPEIVSSLARPRKRITELMLKSLDESGNNVCSKQFKPTFFRSPITLLGNERVQKVHLGINILKGHDLLNQYAVSTDKTEVLNCNLAISSIGYKSVQVDKDIPFDVQKGTAVNTNGKIADGLYVSGWLATGPTGVILTTMTNAFATADLIHHDLQKNPPTKNKGGFDSLRNVMRERNVQLVMWKDWLKIDEYERNEGKKVGKPREKILDVNKMLNIAS